MERDEKQDSMRRWVVKGRGPGQSTGFATWSSSASLMLMVSGLWGRRDTDARRRNQTHLWSFERVVK